MIEWRIHFASPPERIYGFLASDEGRAAFWAEAAPEHEGAIDFSFPDGSHWRGRILEAEAPRKFALSYFGDTEVVFTLADDGSGGCELTLTDGSDDAETMAGWVSVLLALKAAADFGADLRNHDPKRTWRQGYADN